MNISMQGMTVTNKCVKDCTFKSRPRITSQKRITNQSDPVYFHPYEKLILSPHSCSIFHVKTTSQCLVLEEIGGGGEWGGEWGGGTDLISIQTVGSKSEVGAVVPDGAAMNT